MPESATELPHLLTQAKSLHLAKANAAGGAAAGSEQDWRTAAPGETARPEGSHGSGGPKESKDVHATGIVDEVPGDAVTAGRTCSLRSGYRRSLPCKRTRPTVTPPRHVPNSGS